MVTPIVILLLLTSPVLMAGLFFKFKNTSLDRKKYACWGLALTFLFFFMGHVMKADGMVEMLPAFVPYRYAIVYLTGALELFIGLALFSPKYQVAAAKLAIVVFVVFFPANIYSALNGVGLGGHQWGPIYLLIRAPLQIILILWAYFLCVKGNNKPV